MCDSVCVVGMGFIGLPTALMLAANGVDVTGVDIDIVKITSLKKGLLTFSESGMKELFERAMDAGIRFGSKQISADMYIISVPTPFDKHSKKVDACYLIGSVKETIKVCKENSVIVIESTIPPGTIDKYIRPLVRENIDVLGKTIDLAHAPERIMPGVMLNELVNNDRVIGADDIAVGMRVKSIYSLFCNGEIELTDIRTAEMSKVVENAYRDVNIAFANELVKICAEAGIDPYNLIRIANKHPRVNILNPGPGVGGHCISVDPWFLVGDYPGLANLILSARKINDSMPAYVLERTAMIMAEKGIRDISRVGVYGLTYKEDIADIRESPSLQLLEWSSKYLAYGLHFYDPLVTSCVVEGQFFDLDEFIDASDVIIIMVAHKEIIIDQLKLAGKIVIDTKAALKDISTYTL